MKKIFLFIFTLVFLVGCNTPKISDIEILNSVLNSIDIPLELTDNLTLPNTYTYEDKTITATWSSSNEEVLDSEGKVFRTLEDVDVVLTVTLQLEEETINNSYDIIVLALEDEVVADQILALLNMPTETSENILLTQSIKFNDNNYRVNWESSNPNILSNKGLVTFQPEDTIVTLTATISYNKTKYSKTFDIMVKAFNTNDMQTYLNSLNFNTPISNNIELPTTYKCNNHTYSISWTSNNDDILNSSGSVGIVLQDTTVTLTASINIDAVTLTKSFDVLVSKSSNDQILEIIENELTVVKTANDNIFLPTDLGSGITCTWTSSNENIISSEGVLNQQIGTLQEVILTANINIGGEVMTKEYKVIASKTDHFYLLNDFEGTFENVSIDKKGRLVLNECEVIGTFTSKEYTHSGFQEAVVSWGALSSSHATCELFVSLKVGDKFSEYISYGEWGLGNKNASKDQTKDLIKLIDDEIFVLNNKTATGFKYKIVLRRMETNTASPAVTLVAFSFNIKNYSYTFDKSLVKQSAIYDVPRLYQHDVPEIGNIICSATSSAMLLKYKGHDFSRINKLEHQYMAVMVKDHGNNIYGNWVYNCVAMSAYKEIAYVKRFADTYEFLYSLQEIGPMAASIKGTVKYTKQDDGKSGSYTTAGHLLVVTGYEITDNGTFIYINDPNR